MLQRCWHCDIVLCSVMALTDTGWETRYWHVTNKLTNCFQSNHTTERNYPISKRTLETVHASPGNAHLGVKACDQDLKAILDRYVWSHPEHVNHHLIVNLSKRVYFISAPRAAKIAFRN